MKFSTRATALLLLLLPLGCDPSPAQGDNDDAPIGPDVTRPQDTFVIQVVGSQSTLRAFPIELENFVEDWHDPQGEPPKMVYRSSLPWNELANRSFELKLTDGADVIKTIQIKPDACKRQLGDEDFAKHVASGRPMTEVYQVFLDRDGTLEVDSDYDHLLEYRCINYGEDDRVTSMWVSPIHKDQLCSSPDAQGTDFKVTGTWKGQSVEWSPTWCAATLQEAHIGEQIRLDLSGPFQGGALEFSFEHSFYGPREAAPFDFQLKNNEVDGSATNIDIFVLSPDAEFGDSASMMDQFEDVANGSWTIKSADYSQKRGRTTGMLSIDATSDTGDQLKIAGSYDLPFLRLSNEAM